MIPIIGALADLLPEAVGALFGSKSEETVSKATKVVTTVASALTGKSDPDAAAEALCADPQLLVQFRQQVSAETIALYAEDTKRLVAINETMRAEAQSGNRLQSCWRPVFGLIFGASFGIHSVAMAIIPFAAPEQADGFAKMVDSVSSIWTVALAVLGVSVYQRSKDKQVASGAKSGIAQLVEAIRK